MAQEIKPLTGIRGVAACLVVLFHIGNNAQFRDLSLPGFARGYLGVDLFFVLSGFVLALVYGAQFRTGSTGPQIRTFLLHRFARIYPLYILLTVIFTLRFSLNVSGISTPITLPDFLANVLMVQSWGMGFDVIAGSSWSISTEVLAYLLFPALILVSYSRLWPVQLALALAALIVVTMSGQGIEGPIDVVHSDSIMPVLRCLGGFCLGLLAYRLSQTPLALRHLSGSPALVMSFGALLVTLLIPGGDVVVVLTFPTLVIATYFNNAASALLFGNRVVYHLGVISYSIYLWHPLIRDIFARALVIAERHGFARHEILFTLAGIAVTWLISCISHAVIEVRGRRLINHLIQGRSDRTA